MKGFDAIRLILKYGYGHVLFMGEDYDEGAKAEVKEMLTVVCEDCILKVGNCGDDIIEVLIYDKGV